MKQHCIVLIAAVAAFIAASLILPSTADQVSVHACSLRREGGCCETLVVTSSRSYKHESRKSASAMPSPSGVQHALNVAALYTILCACYRMELVQMRVFATCHDSWRTHACIASTSMPVSLQYLA